MPDIKIAATGGGEFDCYIALPGSGTGPALIVMSSIFGVDSDVRGAADDLAAKGIVVAAPDLFWRGDSGPMDRSEEGRASACPSATAGSPSSGFAMAGRSRCWARRGWVAMLDFPFTARRFRNISICCRRLAMRRSGCTGAIRTMPARPTISPVSAPPRTA